MPPLLHCCDQIQTVQQEEERYVGRREGKSLRDLYTKRIQEQETLGKHLREEQKATKTNHDPNLKQLDMWQVQRACASNGELGGRC
jgi:intraflagellar transport protein 81